VKLFVLFMQRKEDVEGETAPQALVTSNSTIADDFPEEFHKAVDEAKNKYANEAAGFALVTLVVDGAKIRDMCLGLDRVMKAQVAS
jgi:hypothetical protein